MSHSPPQRTSKLMPSPGSISAGWEETDTFQNLMIFHMGEKKKPQNNEDLHLFFFPNTSDVGFLIKSPSLPPCLELPLGTSHLQTCPERRTCFSLNLSFDWKSFNIESVWLVMRQRAEQRLGRKTCALQPHRVAFLLLGERKQNPVKREPEGGTGQKRVKEEPGGRS